LYGYGSGSAALAARLDLDSLRWGCFIQADEAWPHYAAAVELTALAMFMLASTDPGRAYPYPALQLSLLYTSPLSCPFLNFLIQIFISVTTLLA
jgi:hypothetical protein